MELGVDRPKKLARAATEIHRWSGFQMGPSLQDPASSDGEDVGATLMLAALDQLAETTVVVICNA